MAIDYTYDSTKETADQYLARTQPSRGGSSASGAADPFIDTLQKKLLAQSDMISSSNTELESKIASAIGGVQKSSAASSARIESEFGREIGYRVDEGELQRLVVNEASTGFARSSALLRLIDSRTDKDLKDLEQRKQELILAGESAAASKVAELQLKSIEFKQQAQQQAFTNMLSTGQFALNVQAERRTADQFKQTIDLNREQLQFNKDSKMAEIATQFGITIDPTDTLDSIVTKASNSEYARLNRERARLEVQNLRKDLADIEDKELDVNIDGLLADAIAGTGQFEGKPVSPEIAAFAAVNYMNTSGIKPNKSDLNRFTERARALKQEYDVEKSKVQAEEEGKSFWANFGNIFGAPAAYNARRSTTERANPFMFSGYDPGQSDPDAYNSFFTGLFAN